MANNIYARFITLAPKVCARKKTLYARTMRRLCAFFFQDSIISNDVSRRHIFIVNCNKKWLVDCYNIEIFNTKIKYETRTFAPLTAVCMRRLQTLRHQSQSRLPPKGLSHAAYSAQAADFVTSKVIQTVAQGAAHC